MSDRDYGDENDHITSGPFGRLPDQDDPYERRIAQDEQNRRDVAAVKNYDLVLSEQAEKLRLDKLMEEDARLLALSKDGEHFNAWHDRDVPVEMVEMIFTEETAQTIPFVTTGSGQKPVKQHQQEDAAFDLCANHKALIVPHSQAIIYTGLRMAIPEGMVGLVCTRSGEASKHGVFVMNAPGIIDPGYRGEVGILLINTSTGPYYIAEGQRIAQLLLLRTPLVQFEARDGLALDTERSDGGFGSTGR